jgi:TonB-dependent starch-binding outer membrane protein SusC
MKKLFSPKKAFVFFISMLFLTHTYAQTRTITGVVTDAADGSLMPGAAVIIKGTTMGTSTGIDGDFTLQASNGDILTVSFVGYETAEVPVVANKDVYNISLQLSTVDIGEVVLIGYGTAKKDDVTGSISVVESDEFNRGSFASPQELFTGKIAGVQITNDGGAPGAKSTIRIRGGSSLTASNDPLIVIDGVPVAQTDVAGMRNPLNTIHPSQIESITVLKDASATAIYGSRASNGVIIITTKGAGGDKPISLSYNGSVSLDTRYNQIDVLTGDEYRSLIGERFGTDSEAYSLLGDANTDWQDEVFENAFSTDHALSANGTVANIPYGASVAYSNKEGLLKTTSLERFTGSINVSPSLLDDHLKVNLNLKGMTIDNRFAENAAIGAATAFDPTQPVFNDSPYGGYTTWLQNNGDPITIATSNPVARLYMREDVSDVQRSIGNLKFDYSFHGLPELKATVNLGYDYSDSDGYVLVDSVAPWAYTNRGESKIYTQSRRNQLLDAYLNYNTGIGANSNLEVTAGYSYEHFKVEEDFEVVLNYAEEDTINPANDDPTESYIISFFGRANYSFLNRYNFTFTLRQDGSSRFSPETRWGLFPSAAFAWNISREPFMESVAELSNLKLRLGYGVTGQQNITDNDYPFQALYTQSFNDARYQLGDQFYYTNRPEGYDANIKWEETITYNAGLDYGLYRNRINGSLDFYHRITEDLINQIPVPAGSNLTNEIITNVGNLTNTGVEFSINAGIISRPDFTWNIGYNITANRNEITKLTATDDPNYPGVFTGGIAGGVGNNIQIHSVDYPSFSYYVYEQVYDENGKPIEGLYVDRNEDGIITLDDRYHFKDKAPTVFMGFNSQVYFKNFDFSFAGRINLGNYNYNNIYSNRGTFNDLYNPVGYLNNVHSNVYATGFENSRFFSDYYVHNASFMRMDHISLGYTFENILDEMLRMRIFATVNNAFIITPYEGLDPEIESGIDNEVYPRPRTFMFGVSVDF